MTENRHFTSPKTE